MRTCSKRQGHRESPCDIYFKNCEIPIPIHVPIYLKFTGFCFDSMNSYIRLNVSTVYHIYELNCSLSYIWLRKLNISINA
jgi:hypothetical protein